MIPQKPRVFVFCRPYLVPDFQENVAPLADKYEFSFLTDGRRPGVRDTRQRFYERMETAPTPTGFSVEDELDVVERCRYLRNLPRSRALKMLRAMASVLEEELETHNPHVVLAQMVDEYITHLLSKIAEIRGIVYAGYIYSYFPEKAQIVLFSDGRPLKVRVPTEMEINEIWTNVSPHNFRQNYKQKNNYSKAQHLKAMLKYKVKQIVFSLLAWRDNDPLNLHYRCLPYVVERRRWRDLPSTNDFHKNWDQLIKKSSENKKFPIVYLPLAYFPESSTDYWVDNKIIINYKRITLNILAILSKNFTVVVKEHMHMLGGRDIQYYSEIKGLANVISVPPTENSNAVLAMCDAVILGGGSVGIESFIRDKPIVSFCDTSCWFSASGATKLNLSDIASWTVKIKQTISSHKISSDVQKLDFLRQCLQSTMRIKKPGKLWPICNTEDLQNLLDITISSSALRVDKEIDGVFVN